MQHLSVTAGFSHFAAPDKIWIGKGVGLYDTQPCNVGFRPKADIIDIITAGRGVVILGAMYTKYWRELRAWTYASWGVFFVLGPVGAFVVSRLRLELVSSYFGWGWFIAFGYTRLVIIYFRCPRCEKYFFVLKGRGFNTGARKCLHCGLQKWAADSR